MNSTSAPVMSVLDPGDWINESRGEVRIPAKTFTLIWFFGFLTCKHANLRIAAIRVESDYVAVAELWAMRRPPSDVQITAE